LNSSQSSIHEPEDGLDNVETSQAGSRSEVGGSLKARVEAILFVAAGPVPTSRLASSLDVTPGKIERALDELREQYERTGLRIQVHHSGVQLTTSPEVTDAVERFLESERTTTLSRAALETLAIIAYQQPTTRPQIDAIRGVNSESSVHTLLRHGLIADVGRSDSPGRPILYETTPDFLGYFGVSSLDDLPPLPIEEAPPAGLEEEGAAVDEEEAR
jgi:segregation and condensation protein B